MKNIALSFMVFKNCDFCSSVRNKKYFEKKLFFVHTMEVSGL